MQHAFILSTINVFLFIFENFSILFDVLFNLFALFLRHLYAPLHVTINNYPNIYHSIHMKHLYLTLPLSLSTNNSMYSLSLMRSIPLFVYSASIILNQFCLTSFFRFINFDFAFVIIYTHIPPA